MNSLNLRVSNAKSGENIKKNSEIRASLVELPKQYVASSAAHVEQFRKAKTVPQQVNCVKQIFLGGGRQNKEVLHFLTDLIFDTALNHPVRNQIVKLFSNETATHKASSDAIHLALKQGLRLHLLHVSEQTDDKSRHDLIISIGGCFSNFPSGLRALEKNLEKYLNILYDAMQRNIAVLGETEQLSPSKANEYYLYLHNSLRYLVACLQEFEIIPASYNNSLQVITLVCTKLAVNDEVPMETRLNAALLVAQIAKHFEVYEVFINEVKSICKARELPLCISALNSFNAADYYKHSAAFLSICTNISQLGHEHATVPNVLVYSVRALYQLARNLLELPRNMSAITIAHSKLALRNMLLFAFSYLQHHIDTVRHLSRDLLKQVMVGARHLQFEQLHMKVYEACNGERLELPAKCIVLQQAVTVLGANVVLRHCPHLFEQIFSDHLGRDPAVDAVYEGIMIGTYNCSMFDAWWRIWLAYLLEVAAIQDMRLPGIEVLLTKTVKLDERIVPLIMNTSNLSPSTKLSVMWSVRKSGAPRHNIAELLANFEEELRSAMLSANDEVSLMALKVIVDTHKTTEPLTQFECQNISIYVDYHTNCSDPAVRQRAYALLNKALMRCEGSLVKVYKRRMNFDEPMADSVPLVFLRDFMHAMVTNLFPTANFTRRWLSLLLLQQCLNICKSLKFAYAKLLPEDSVKRIMAILGDSYESNKSLAVDLLKQLESQVPEGLVKTYNLELHPTGIGELLTSLRPPDSAMGAFQLDFYCNHALPESFGVSCVGTQHYPVIYAALTWCLQKLQQGLQVAQQNLQRAAKFNPLYGLLYGMRHLLKPLNMKLIAQEPLWRAFIRDLVQCCMHLTAVVGPVVNCSSPEGHLPYDVSELGGGFDNNDGMECIGLSAISATRRLNSNLLEQMRTTPQMILLCAWRTVKEVSLILGELVLHAPFQTGQQQKQNYLLTKVQVHELGEHFKQLLGETKHRGAFEQAYVGFTMYCIRLWLNDAVQLNTKPLKWLKELLAAITDQTEQSGSEKLCATRRSAGLPFMVQALVTSELQVGSTKALHCSMEHLLATCAADTQATRSESRTHCLNILRALFRCSDLNETVGEFVAQGVVCALNSYNADTWPERNSATLLFAALMTRIFGVQRTKDTDNLSIRNRMTGRIFFTRYAKLYDYFLEQLSDACELVLKGLQAPKLHPMLLLLSRLYPSSLEGAESNLNIADFIPLISVCGGVPEMHTRCLVAKALVALVDKDALHETLLRKCAGLQNKVTKQTSCHLNILHGELLQIQYLLKQCKKYDETLIAEVAGMLASFMRISNQNNYVLMKSILDILNMLLAQQVKLPYKRSTISDLLHCTTERYHNINEQCGTYYPVIRKSYHLYLLHVQRLTLPAGSLADYMLCPLIVSKLVHTEIIESTINIVLLLQLLAKPDGPHDMVELDEFEFGHLEEQFVDVMPTDYRLKLTQHLCECETLHELLLNIVEQERYYPDIAMKCYAVLSMLEPYSFELEPLLRQAKKFAGDVKSSISMCVVRYVFERGVADGEWLTLLTYALEIVDPWLPNSLRYKAVQLLEYIAPHFVVQLRAQKLQIIGAYAQLVLQLLMDDWETIRHYVATIVLHNLNEGVDLSKFLLNWPGYSVETINSIKLLSAEDVVVPTLAQQVFLQGIVDICVDMKVDDEFLLNVFRVIVEPHLPPQPMPQDEPELNSKHTDADAVAADGVDAEAVAADGVDAEAVAADAVAADAVAADGVDADAVAADAVAADAVAADGSAADASAAATSAEASTAAATPAEAATTTATPAEAEVATVAATPAEAKPKDEGAKPKEEDIAAAKDATTTSAILLEPDIFDRNEANVYSEPLKVVMDMLIVYEKTFVDREALLQQLQEYKQRVQIELM